MNEYDHIATKEELETLTKEECTLLSKRLSESNLIVDEKTFVPYLVLDRVRYDIEPIVDSGIKK